MVDVNAMGRHEMITRYAIFIGQVRPGQEAGFRAFVENRLAPLWRQFEGAATVRVEYGMDQDPAGPEIPLMLAITYPDRAAMTRALESPARYASRDLLPELYETYLDAVLHHYVMETDCQATHG